MPINNFAQSDGSVIAPYQRAVTLTPSDSTDLVEFSRGLNVYATVSPTTVKVIMQNDTTPVTLQLQTGVIYPLRVSRVYATGTAATAIIALY